MAMNPLILSITEQDPASKEEALIERDSDIFDIEITISPISVSRAWQTQVKILESEGPQGVNASLYEKDKLIQSMKKKLNIFATEHPQKIELVDLEQEKDTFRQEALNYKEKVLQLEKKKVNWSQGQAVTSDMVAIVPSTTENGPNTDGLVQAMSQVSLKEG
jgi:hypothetical protein